VSNFRIVILASGSGSLLQALIDAQEIHQADLVGLITDRDCKAISRAAQAGIPAQIVELNADRESWNQEIVKVLKNLKPDLIVSAGFMRILGAAVLKEFEGKIINTHPALLPNFPGAHAVRDALTANASVSGGTIHFVDQGVDTGKVIRQHPVEILPGDSESQLHERIKQIERDLLVEVVSDFVSGKIKSRSRS
jgi:phosphoribosylglycinamide formyltransferase-1